MPLQNLTKVTDTVTDIPLISQAIKTDTSPTGMRVYVDGQVTGTRTYTDGQITTTRAYIDSTAIGLQAIITSNFNVTAKTNQSMIWTYPQYFQSSIREKVVSANSTTAYTIDNSVGTIFLLTLTANTTLTFPTVTEGQSFTLYIKQDATGSRTITWPSTVAWPNGTAPVITTTANRTDAFAFNAVGSKWIGVIGPKNYTGV